MKKDPLTKTLVEFPQKAEEVGIEESLKVADILGTAITSVANMDSNRDGKVQTLEVLNSLQIVAFKAITGRPDLKKLKAEVRDYDEDEKLELSLTVSQATQMPKAKTDRLVDSGIKILIDVIDFVVEVQQPESSF